MAIHSAVRKANQIAANFSHHPVEQAAGEVAFHINRFWTPAMKAELIGLLTKADNGLSPRAVAAVEKLRDA